MARNRHGGVRKPSKPAAVSGPGSLSQRTDGQPIRDRTGLNYGQAKMLREQQEGAPMSTGPQAPASAAVAPGGAPLPPGGAFGPTQRPGEPATTGVPFGPGAGPSAPVSDDDPLTMIRAMYSVFPTEGLRRLLEKFGG